MYFKDRAQTSKTVYCISCSIVCKIFFAQNSPIFQLTLAESQEEHRQLQSILRFMQTQKNSVMVVVITLDDRNRKRRFMFYFCNFAHFQCCIIQLSNFLSCFRMQVQHTK